MADAVITVSTAQLSELIRNEVGRQVQAEVEKQLSAFLGANKVCISARIRVLAGELAFSWICTELESRSSVKFKYPLFAHDERRNQNLRNNVKDLLGVLFSTGNNIPIDHGFALLEALCEGRNESSHYCTPETLLYEIQSLSLEALKTDPYFQVLLKKEMLFLTSAGNLIGRYLLEPRVLHLGAELLKMLIPALAVEPPRWGLRKGIKVSPSNDAPPDWIQNFRDAPVGLLEGEYPWRAICNAVDDIQHRTTKVHKKYGFHMKDAGMEFLLRSRSLLQSTGLLADIQRLASGDELNALSLSAKLILCLPELITHQQAAQE